MRKALIAVTLAAAAGMTTYAVWLAPHDQTAIEAAVQSPPLTLAPSRAAAPVREDWPQGESTPEIVPVIVNEPKPAFRPVVRSKTVATQPEDDRRGLRVLAMALQGELRRVGCYRGVIDGAWLGASQVSMQRFLDLQNAKLPVDRPDQALLSLLQSAESGACNKKVKTPDFVTVVKPALRGYGDETIITGRGLTSPPSLATMPRASTLTRGATAAALVADGASGAEELPQPMTVGRTEPQKPRTRYRPRDRSVESLFKHPLGGGF